MFPGFAFFVMSFTPAVPSVVRHHFANATKLVSEGGTPFPQYFGKLKEGNAKKYIVDLSSKIMSMFSLAGEIETYPLEMDLGSRANYNETAIVKAIDDIGNDHISYAEFLKTIKSEGGVNHYNVYISGSPERECHYHSTADEAGPYYIQRF